MKKTISLWLAAVLAVGCLAACGSGSVPSEAEGGGLRIVTTIFPEYDWVMNVLGDNPAGAEVTMLLDSGVDLHSFQPTAEDILKISTCDLFICVGGESDEWVEDALREAANRDMVVVELLDVLGDAAREEETVEGMQPEDHDHDHDEDHDQEEEPEYDEHVWLSLRNAAVFTEAIARSLQSLDPDHAADYARSAAAYIDRLNALDAEYRSAVEGAGVTTLLFGDRFPFRYLVEDYGLSYYAAFAGCSAETEASFETIRFLAQKTDELSLPAVLTLEGSDRRIAETIVQNTRTEDLPILTMDSMQSATAADVRAGMTYLSVMEGNLAVLRAALGAEAAA